MIQNYEVLNEIKDSWNGVITLKEKFKGAIAGSIAAGGTFAIFAADAVQNIPFIHACSVLNDTLFQFAKEEHFKCRSHLLGVLVEASKKNLQWNDYDLILEIVKKRNDIAHRGEILKRGDCWRYIDAIENQLISWNILTKNQE